MKVIDLDQKTEKPGSLRFVSYINNQQGFTFEYPMKWQKDFSRGRLLIRPLEAKTVVEVSGKIAEIIFSPCITMLVGERNTENPLQFYKDFLDAQRRNFDKYKLLWEHPFTLSSGEEALEWTFEFARGPHDFTAISVLAAKPNRIFHLDCSCLNSQIQNLEPILRRIVESLSLIT